MTPPSRQARQGRQARPAPAPDAPGVSQEAVWPTGGAGGASEADDEVERLADRVAAAVRGCSAVARLADGPVATYLPGRLVRGVAVRGGEVRVAVIARYGPPLPQVAADVRAAARQVDPQLRVEVLIEDIELPTVGTRS